MDLENRSGLSPFGEAVLVIPYEPDLYKKDSIIIVPESFKAGLKTIENRMIVVEIGPMAWRNEGRPRCRPWDKVIISKYSGYQVRGPLDGKVYRMLNADDIFCGITDHINVYDFLKEQGYV